jgi:ABC-type uncharacterized transport system substrate-binding protein
VRLQLETHAKFVPQARKWGTIYNPAEANSVSHVQSMREAAKSLGLELIEATTMLLKWSWRPNPWWQGARHQHHF